MTLTFDEPLLSAEQERELAELMRRGLRARAALSAQAGVPFTVTDGPPARQGAARSASELSREVEVGVQARTRFVLANLRLVARVSNVTARRASLDADELFQEGVVGLLEAVDRFEIAHGARFATFALPWIRMRVGEAALTRCGELGLPVRRAKQWVRVVAAHDALSVAQGRTPGPDELAEAVGLTVPEVEELAAFRPPLCGDFVDDIAHSDPDDDDVEELGWIVRRLLHRLSGDERAVLMRLYGLGPFTEMSCPEIAAELGVSESTVRRRERAALARLRAQEGAMAVAVA